MNVGDLVALSSHGKTLVMMNHRKGKVGLIVEKKKRQGPQWISPDSDPFEYLYRVQWLSLSNPFDAFDFHRRDLKFINKRKKT